MVDPFLIRQSLKSCCVAIQTYRGYKRPHVRLSLTVWRTEGTTSAYFGASNTQMQVKSLGPLLA